MHCWNCVFACQTIWLTLRTFQKSIENMNLLKKYWTFVDQILQWVILKLAFFSSTNQANFVRLLSGFRWSIFFFFFFFFCLFDTISLNAGVGSSDYNVTTTTSPLLCLGWLTHTTCYVSKNLNMLKSKSDGHKCCISDTIILRDFVNNLIYLW